MIKLIDIKGFTLILDIDGKKEEFNLNDLFSIDDTDMTDEFSHQVAMFGRFSVLTARADEQYSKCKFKTQQMYSDADAGYREELDKEEKKYTEAVVKSLVLTDVDYEETYKSELDAEHLYKLLRSIMHTFDQRANMLISMGAHLRAEFGMTGMNIREKHAESIEDAKEILRKRKGK